MADITVFGFPHSSFVHIAQLVLAHKDVPYRFHDLEPDMGSSKHLALHPFDRVPILQHGDFVLYETSAIVAYLEELFPTPALQPDTPQGRARMNQWISAINSYYYPYMIYNLTHELIVVPELGIASDEKVVAHAMPKVELALGVVERELSHGDKYLLGSSLTLADFYLLPSTFALGLTEQGKAMYRNFPAFCRWRDRIEELPTTRKLRASLPPRAPIAHAREWANSHRPKY